MTRTRRGFEVFLARRWHACCLLNEEAASVSTKAGGSEAKGLRLIDGGEPQARWKRKIVTLGELPMAVRRRRVSGGTLVHCHGCFDVVHAGHLRYLELARRQADVLLVTLTSDDAIEKGDGTRPYVPEELRAEALAALELVDLVTIVPDSTALPAIRAAAPDVYVKGKEYEGSKHAGFVAETALVESLGGRVMFSSGEVVFSSTALMSEQRAAAHAGACPDELRLRVSCERWGVDRGSLSALLQEVKGQRVVVIGDCTLDHYVDCSASDVAAESAALSVAVRDECQFAGSAAALALHLRALGAEPHLVARLGTDRTSAALLERLAAARVTVTPLASSTPPPQRYRYLVGGQELLRVEHAESVPADSAHQRDLCARVSELAPEADAMILADYGHGTLTDVCARESVARSRAHVAVLAGGVGNPQLDGRGLAGVDLLALTEKSLRTRTADHDGSLPGTALSYMSGLDVGRLMVTPAAGGMMLFRPREAHSDRWFQSRLRSEYLPPLTARAVDRVGASEAVLAAGTLALAARASWPLSGYFAAACAALQSESMGLEAVSSPALHRWLDQRPELAPAASMPAPIMRRKNLAGELD